MKLAQIRNATLHVEFAGKTPGEKGIVGQVRIPADGESYTF